MSINKDLNALLAKIRALLDKAESTQYEAEAVALRAKAEELMAKYRIDQEAVLAVDPSSVEPILEVIDLGVSASTFLTEYQYMFIYAANHCGVRVKLFWASTRQGTQLRAQVVGYEADVRYCTYLYTAARLVFQDRLEPQPDSKLPDIENVYRLRSAGIERNKIARMLWGLDTHAAHAKVGALYREACEARGEDAAVSGRRVNAKTFRKVYADQFVAAYARRLREARDAADSAGGALVLKSRKERVDEAFYKHFPEYRPRPATAEVDVKGRKPAKARKWTQADEERYQRMTNSPSALAGRDAAQTAAQTIEIDRVARAKRLHDAEPTGLEIGR